MTVFSKAVFDGTVVFEGNELFKGQGSARQWAEQVARELEIPVEPVKIGTGWALSGTVDGTPTLWGIYGQRLKRITPAAQGD